MAYWLKFEEVMRLESQAAQHKELGDGFDDDDDYNSEGFKW